MKITRKGYFTITDPDGELLTKPDGTTRQVTNKDEAFERILEKAQADMWPGKYYIHPPLTEVDVGVTDAGYTEEKDWSGPEDQPPTVDTTPAPSFVEDTADTYDLSQHITDDGLSALTYSLTNVLPNGLTLNPSTGLLTYDGLGTDSLSQHVMTVADAVGSDDSVSFNISILIADQVPDAFSFVDQTDIALSTLTPSAPVVISGLNTTSPISVSIGEWQKNSGGWQSASGTVSNGDSIEVRHTSSASSGTATNQVVTIGGVQDTFTSTTIASDSPYEYPITGTTYYVSSAGSDSNTGLSHAQAWLTYSKAQDEFSSLSAGDGIVFHRGDTFTVSGNTEWHNSNGTDNSRVVISSYLAAGDSPTLDYPIINQTGGGSGFVFNSSSIAGIAISKLFLEGNSGGGWGIAAYNAAQNIDLYDITFDNWAIGILPSPTGGQLTKFDIRYCDIFNSSEHGCIGGAAGFQVLYCQFQNNGWGGGANPQQHNLYLTAPPTTGSVIRGNKLYQSSMTAGIPRGSSLNVNGTHYDLILEDNVIWEDVTAGGNGAYGIHVFLNTGGEEFPDMIVRNNVVVNAGGVPISLNSCPNVLVDGNTVIHETNAHSASCINVPSGNESSAADFADGTIENNVIMYDSTQAGTGIDVGRGIGETFNVDNNDIYYTIGTTITDINADSGDTVNQSGNTETEGFDTGLYNAAKAQCVIN